MKPKPLHAPLSRTWPTPAHPSARGTIAKKTLHVLIALATLVSSLGCAGPNPEFGDRDDESMSSSSDAGVDARDEGDVDDDGEGEADAIRSEVDDQVSGSEEVSSTQNTPRGTDQTKPVDTTSGPGEADPTTSRALPPPDPDAEPPQYQAGESVYMPFYNVALIVPQGWHARQNGTGLLLINDSDDKSALRAYGWRYFNDEYAKANYDNLAPELGSATWEVVDKVRQDDGVLIQTYREKVGGRLGVALTRKGPYGLALRVDGVAETVAQLETLIEMGRVVLQTGGFAKSYWYDVLYQQEIGESSSHSVTSVGTTQTESRTTEQLYDNFDGTATLVTTTETWEAPTTIYVDGQTFIKACDQEWGNYTSKITVTDAGTGLYKYWGYWSVSGERDGGRFSLLTAAGDVMAFNLAYDSEGNLLLDNKPAYSVSRPCTTPAWVPQAYADGEESIDDSDSRYWDDELKEEEQGTEEQPVELPGQAIEAGATLSASGGFSITFGDGFRLHEQSDAGLVLSHTASLSVVEAMAVSGSKEDLTALLTPQLETLGTVAKRQGNVESGAALVAAQYLIDEPKTDLVLLFVLGPEDRALLLVGYNQSGLVSEMASALVALAGGVQFD